MYVAGKNSWQCLWAFMHPRADKSQQSVSLITKERSALDVNDVYW